MLNILTPFAIGFVAIYLGTMGFSLGGIPWTKEKNITGKPARVIGTACLILGVGFVVLGVWLLVRMSSR